MRVALRWREASEQKVSTTVQPFIDPKVLEQWGDMMLEEATDDMVKQDIMITPETLSTFFQQEYELPLTPDEAQNWLLGRTWYPSYKKGERA